MMRQAPERFERIRYAFGHMVSGFGTDAHAGDSAELADDVLTELGFTAAEREIVHIIAEHVADNYQYTGAQELRHE